MPTPLPYPVQIPSGIPLDTIRRRVATLDDALDPLAAASGVAWPDDLDGTGLEGTDGLAERPLRTRLLAVLAGATLGARLDTLWLNWQGRQGTPTDGLVVLRNEIRRLLAFLDETLARREAWQTAPSVEAVHAMAAIDEQIWQCFVNTFDAVVRLRQVPGIAGTPALAGVEAAWYETVRHHEALRAIVDSWRAQVLPPLATPLEVTVTPSPARTAARARVGH